MSTMLPRNLARRLDLASMSIFVATAETGSISKAAARESIALSAASKRLSDIESAFGTQLMYRSGKGITLTPAGYDFLHHARIVLRGVEQMESRLSEHAIGIRGHVRLHATLAAITHFASSELAAFAQENTNIEVELAERVAAEVIRGVQDGEADIGISTIDEAPPDVECRPYREDRLVVIAPTGHSLATRTSVSFSETLDFEHVELHEQSATSRVIHRTAARLGRAVRTRVRVTGPDVMCHMVCIGMGVGILPHMAVARAGSLQGCHEIPLTDEWAVRRLHLLARSFDGLSVPARRLALHLLGSETR